LFSWLKKAPRAERWVRSLFIFLGVRCSYRKPNAAIDRLSRLETGVTSRFSTGCFLSLK
jgi:hypothetical protein